jgi:hypothetical protein
VPVDGLASILVTEHHEGTKPALFVVRAFHGARRPHACRCGFFRRGGRDLFCRSSGCVARVSPGLAGLTRAGRWFGFGFGRRASRGYEASSLGLFVRGRKDL